MDYPAIEDWVAERGLELHSFLGQGIHGTAWLLSNGQVLKVTFDENETRCLRWLASMDIESPHLPVIYEYGELTGPEVYDEYEGYGSPPGREFYILREYLAPLPASLLNALPPSSSPLLDREYVREKTPEVEAFYEQYARAIEELESIPGVIWRDMDYIQNWGLREDGTLVMFDVSCIKEMV